MALPSQPNESLIDGLECLQWVAGSGKPAGSRELAKTLELDPTRVNRLLKTLAHLGLLKQDERRKYGPGPGLHILAAQALFGSGLLRRAVPGLESLGDTGYTVALGVLWRDRVSYLYHALPGMGAAEALGRGALFPAAESGVGLAILAKTTLKSARMTLGAQASPVVLDALREAKHQGYALTPLRPKGGRSLGVALPDASAAIAISGVMTDQQADHLAHRVEKIVQQIAVAGGAL